MDGDGQGVQVAPFVAKTYQMVSDPRTDALVRWGREHNSFLVTDPSNFSLLILPVYFKHGNFSSFVRQLNTYGFRKVDPDRWEFAHESFLRGQDHLLPLVARRKRKKEDEDEDEDETLMREIGVLRREQRAMEEEMQGMSRRLQVTEQRPHQMISFLVKVAEDPDLLNRLVLSQKERQQSVKRPRVAAAADSAAYCLPPLPQSIEDGQMQPTGGLAPEFGEGSAVAYPFSLLGHVFF